MVAGWIHWSVRSGRNHHDDRVVLIDPGTIAPKPQNSPVVAVAGRALDGGGGVTGGGEADFFVFSLHADRKVGLCGGRRGVALAVCVMTPVSFG